MAKERFRLQYMFWLDMNKPEEHALAETIAELKENKTFSKVVREGIRLMVDLWQGNLVALLTLFPWVEEAFFERFQKQQPELDHALREQLARLEYLMGQGIRPTINTGTIQTSSPLAGPKPLAAPSFALPRFDDDDGDTLIITKNHDTGSATNFVNMMKDLQ